MKKQAKSLEEVILTNGYIKIDLGGKTTTTGYKKIIGKLIHLIVLFGKGELQMSAHITGCENEYDSGIINKISPADLQVLIKVFCR